MNRSLFILFRTYCLLLGRFAFFSKLLRQVMVRVLITARKQKYTAANQYFDPRELE